MGKITAMTMVYSVRNRCLEETCEESGVIPENLGQFWKNMGCFYNIRKIETSYEQIVKIFRGYLRIISENLRKTWKDKWLFS